VGAIGDTGLDLRKQFADTKQAIASAKFGRRLRMRGVFDIPVDRVVMELSARKWRMRWSAGLWRQAPTAPCDEKEC
jgi:hypothetical protein